MRKCASRITTGSLPALKERLCIHTLPALLTAQKMWSPQRTMVPAVYHPKRRPTAHTKEGRRGSTASHGVNR